MKKIQTQIESITALIKSQLDKQRRRIAYLKDKLNYFCPDRYKIDEDVRVGCCSVLFSKKEDQQQLLPFFHSKYTTLPGEVVGDGFVTIFKDDLFLGDYIISKHRSFSNLLKANSLLADDEVLPQSDNAYPPILSSKKHKYNFYYPVHIAHSATCCGANTY